MFDAEAEKNINFLMENEFANLSDISRSKIIELGRYVPALFFKVSVLLEPSWNISQLKSMLAARLNTPEDTLKVIFAGKELPNDLTINQCDLGNHSILHAVRVVAELPKPRSIAEEEPTIIKEPKNSKINDTPTFGTKEINKDIPTLETSVNDACNTSLLCDSSMVMSIQLSDQEIEQLQAIKTAGEGTERPYFYVFCSSPCASVKVGKLRVRCATCKQGALTVNRDPTCWKDVLESQQVPIVCENPYCEGEYAEFYFKCRDHETLGETDTAIVLYLVRGNVSGILCLSCLDISTPVIVFECESSHTVCLDCFVTYCISKLNERKFVYDKTEGYTLLCPIGCPDSIIKEPHHFKLMGERQYDRFQRFATEEALLNIGGVMCPRPGCGQGLVSEENCRRIVCDCGFVFCKSCLQGFHIGECIVDSTDYYETSHEQNTNVHDRWEQASKLQIKSSTKPCPKCRTPTERDGGCMHMVCTRSSCEFHWCWVCQTEWTRECMGAHWFG